MHGYKFIKGKSVISQFWHLVCLMGLQLHGYTFVIGKGVKSILTSGVSANAWIKVIQGKGVKLILAFGMSAIA